MGSWASRKKMVNRGSAAATGLPRMSYLAFRQVASAGPAGFEAAELEAIETAPGITKSEALRGRAAGNKRARPDVLSGRGLSPAACGQSSREDAMKSVAAFAMILASALIAGGQRAEARDYPWCLVETSPDGDGGITCLYETLEQCRASQAGGGTNCEKNPAYWWGKPGYEGSQPWTYGPRRAR